MNAARQDDQEMDDEQPPELFIKFEAEEDPLQQADDPLISHSAEERIINMLKEISEENKGLREQVQILSKKLDVMADKLSEVSAAMKVQVQNEAEDVKFPLQTVMELEYLDSLLITKEVSDIYVKKIWSLIASCKLSKSIKNVMEEGLILLFNLDGTAGKMSLKSYKKFYTVLEMATRMKSPGDCAEKALRKAILNVKNNTFQKNLRARTNS
ncbi:uncharacterized protein LOC117900225 isoform X2 [Drosophila subobscura]|uniref:uncharacterized protein LOC117900225 isoform X2 n=1 Tax=Drosophila subobscura TaxID=7241 RepID=UPI00155B0E6E|nr:uncharacterized protein LOC117900225 isoform X2 [Drosophila subobscura]